jgi:hypothetical protein
LARSQEEVQAIVPVLLIYQGSYFLFALRITQLAVWNHSAFFERVAFRRRDPVIKKVKEGYKVMSEKGKNLGGPYKSKSAAEKRLRQVEYFKHNKD